MSTRNVAYWARRAALLQFDRMEQAEVVAQEIAEIYYHAARTIAYEAEKIFRGFTRRFSLSEADAMRLLNLMPNPGDIKGLQKALERLGTDEAKAMSAWLNTPPVRARLGRLQALQEQVDEVSRGIYKQDLRAQQKWYTNLGRDTYYHTIYDVQREAGFQFSFAHVDDKLIRKTMNSSWGGATFSERLWSNVDGVAKEVRKQLTLNLITGKTERKIAKEIGNKYGVGAFESRRLVRTESCYLSNEIQFDAYEECGADRYMYIATLDSKTDEECGKLDRKIFDIKDRKIGVNSPPMHPFCRCTTKIYIDQDTRNDMKRRARNPRTGKNEIVSANKSYEEWAKENGI